LEDDLEALRIQIKEVTDEVKVLKMQVEFKDETIKSLRDAPSQINVTKNDITINNNHNHFILQGPVLNMSSIFEELASLSDVHVGKGPVGFVDYLVDCGTLQRLPNSELFNYYATGDADTFKYLCPDGVIKIDQGANILMDKLSDYKVARRLFEIPGDMDYLMDGTLTSDEMSLYMTKLQGKIMECLDVGPGSEGRKKLLTKLRSVSSRFQNETRND